ncbi:Late embryogenesis abundant protein, LEA-14 [Artemisia annua]|uniref:Late embryogenesis abundant protein, LEA-14 n=1 Tax=Artemisia annua TaxID=35608 RepID=A0A2U1M3A1_ARTAN|nr:Late embryogenesis abundant protein, LEA-14 [Artemisia annua]
MVPTNPYGHVNDQDLSFVANEARRKRRRRCLMSIVIITTCIAAILLLFSLTAGRFRTPKFRVRSATFGTFNIVNSTTNASFEISMNTEVGIKNTNFRRFRYRSTTVEYYYQDRKVGEGNVFNENVKARDTRKFVVPVILSSSNVTSSSELRNDLNVGVLPLRSRSRLTGKFKILVVFRKYKHVNMDCTMDLVVASRVLRNISCR